MSKHKAGRDVLYGGPDDESFSAESALDYLADREEAQLTDGQEVEVAKYRRKVFAFDVFERALAACFDDIVSSLEEEYACEDPIGLENLEDEFTEAAAKLLLRMAKRETKPRQCELVEVQTWRWSGSNWERSEPRATP